MTQASDSMTGFEKVRTLSQFDEVELQAEGQEAGPVRTRRPPSAMDCILSASLHFATTAEDRRLLASSATGAIVIVVPATGWVKPLEDHLRVTIADKRLFIARDGSHKSRDRSDVGNDEVAKALSAGRGVVGIAANTDILPSSLVAAADVTIAIAHPDSRVIGEAIRAFTGSRDVPTLAAGMAVGFNIHDIVGAFRLGATLDEICARLAPRVVLASTYDDVPDLRSAVEYGAARRWALDLAAGIEDFRAGRSDLKWRDLETRIIISSPPGFGKTWFATSLAKLLCVPLVVSSVSDLFAGSSGYLDGVIKEIRAVFARARSAGDGIGILFLDELDALPNRVTMDNRAREWWTPVVTEFLLQLDRACEDRSTGANKTGLIVVGATNFVAGVDPALLRPGRLERSVIIDLPDEVGIMNIMRHHLRGDLADTDLSALAAMAEGSTPAELMAVVRSARAIARREKRDLTLADLTAVVFPQSDLPPATLRRSAIHECGHAVVSIALDIDTLERLVIADKLDAHAHTVFRRDLMRLDTKEAIEHRTAALLGGRAAEICLLGECCSGSGGHDSNSDLGAATTTITALHTSYCLGETLVYLGSPDRAIELLRFDAGLRATVEKHLRDIQNRANEIVAEHRAGIEAMANALAQKRFLSGDEARRIFRENAPAQLPQTEDALP